LPLPTQFVGYHRLARDRRHDSYPNPSALDRFDQPPIFTVAGEKHHLVELVREFHGVDRQLDAYFAFDTTTAAGIDGLFHRLGNHGVSVIIEPIDQWPDRGVLILDDGGVIESTHKLAAAFEFIQ